MRGLRRLYRPVLEAALGRRGITVAIAALLFAGALFVARGIGSEFMPPLNEGDLMFMPIADPRALAQVLVSAPGGAQIPLGQLAHIEHARGPVIISSERVSPAQACERAARGKVGLIRFGGRVNYVDPGSSSFVEESLQGLDGVGISSRRSPVDAVEHPVAI